MQQDYCLNKHFILSWLNSCGFEFKKIRTINNKKYEIDMISKVIEFEEYETITKTFAFYINEYYFLKADIKKFPLKFEYLIDEPFGYQFEINRDDNEDLSDFNAEIIEAIKLDFEF